MKNINIRSLIISYGFLIVFFLVFIGLSIASTRFFTLSNLMAVLHTAAPLMVTSSGLTLVIIGGKLDTS
jgi:ribose/xylose/arabinose/galactoside ABC-type transport system permease subunit